MRSRSSILAFCTAALAQVHAKIQFTNSDYTVVPGEPFELNWGDGDGSPVSISIATGPDALHLNNLATIASGLTSAFYTLTFPTSVPPGKYAFTIAQDSVTNYSPLFTVGSTAAISTPADTASLPSTTTCSMGTGTLVYPLGTGFTGLPTATYPTASGGILPPYIRYPANAATNGSGSLGAIGSGMGMPIASQGFMGPAEAFLGESSRLSSGWAGAMVATVVGLVMGAWVMA